MGSQGYQYRDFISFWFPDSELEKLGLKKRQGFYCFQSE